MKEPALIARLIDSATRLAKLRRAKTISLAAGDCHQRSGIFERPGFSRRECAPIVVSHSRSSDTKTVGIPVQLLFYGRWARQLTIQEQL
jgi:hypothetical protein